MSGYGRRGGDYMGAAASTYRSSRVMSSTPAELIVLLYERLLADLKGAAIAIRANDIETKCKRVQRATDVILELMASLDREAGGEVSQRLAALYTYMISRVGEASRQLDPAGMDEVASHVESLLAAWRTVAQERAVAEPMRPQ